MSGVIRGKDTLMPRLTLFLATLLLAGTVSAGELAPRPGWVVTETGKDHSTLLADLKSSVKAAKMGVVTQAGPTATARKRGIDIPENRVVGVFNNDFAVRILNLSVAAMIEAPMRFYVTENPDGTATLSYKLPSFILEPYADDGGDALREIAAELDARFAQISENAVR